MGSQPPSSRKLAGHQSVSEGGRGSTSSVPHHHYTRDLPGLVIPEAHSEIMKPPPILIQAKLPVFLCRAPASSLTGSQGLAAGGLRATPAPPC